MAREAAGRGKRLGLFWLRLLVFVLLGTLMLSYATYVLTPKHLYGIPSMINLYSQPKDSIDVLCVGTSLVYAGVNTNVLWHDFGIAAYNLCSAEQPYWISYYMIREALKTQRPKVILLDAKPAMYPKDHFKPGRIVLSTFGILGLENRWGAMVASVEQPWDAVRYMVGLPEVHHRYKELQPHDFRFPPGLDGVGSHWKGYIESDQIDPQQRPSLVWNSVKRTINPREAEYAEKIFLLAQEEQIPVVLLSVPNPDYAYDHMYFNALFALGEKYGVTVLNYNQPSLRFGLRYASDFADAQHLNVKGSIKFTTRLGEDMTSMFDLPDRRNDPKYASYDECARQWFSRLDTFISSGVEGESP